MTPVAAIGQSNVIFFSLGIGRAADISVFRTLKRMIFSDLESEKIYLGVLLSLRSLLLTLLTLFQVS